MHVMSVTWDKNEIFTERKLIYERELKEVCKRLKKTSEVKMSSCHNQNKFMEHSNRLKED